MVTFGSPKADLTDSVASAASADDKFSFEVPNAALGPIGLDTAQGHLRRRRPVGDRRQRPPAGRQRQPRPRGRAAQRQLRTTPAPNSTWATRASARSARSTSSGSSSGSRSARRRAECVPHLGVEDQEYFLRPEEYGTIDYGVPTYALCGEVGLTGGPSILGVSAISLDAGLSLATYDDRPSVLRAFGDLNVDDDPVRQRVLRAPHRRLHERSSAASTTAEDGFAHVEGKHRRRLPRQEVERRRRRARLPGLRGLVPRGEGARSPARGWPSA